jgi:site-specific DNA-cytosine methylase
MAGKQLGDKDERGMLFWVMLDIMKHVKHYNPNANFLIENVKMKKEFEQYITTHTENALGHVHKILINSALVSAQNRNRYYWTSFEVEQPEDKGILLKDIIEHDVSDEHYHTQKAIDYMERGNEKWMQAGNRRADRYTQDETKDKAFTVTANIHKGVPYNYFKCGAMRGRYIVDGKRGDHLVGSQKGITEQRLEIRKDEKTNTLTTVQKDNYVVRNKSKTVRSGGRGSYDRHEWDSISNCHYRKLTPRECMRLQTVPEHHIDTLLNAGISNTQLYKMCGNGWTMEVIRHIFKGIG